MSHRFPPLNPLPTTAFKPMPSLPWGELLVATTLLLILCV